MIVKSGIITSDEQWNGDIRVRGDVVIPENVSLTIEAGSTITFEPVCEWESNVKNEIFNSPEMSNLFHGKRDNKRCYIIVHGMLRASGVKEKMVLIGNEEWGGGVLIVAGGECRFEFCSIQHAFCAIGLYKSRRAEIISSEISGNRLGIWGIADTATLVASSNVLNNTSGISLFGSHDPKLIDSSVVNNEHAGMRFWFTCPVIEGNRVSGHDIGINQCNCPRSYIGKNTISGNKTGIYSNDIEHLEIVSNIFGDNGTALVNHEKIGKIYVSQNEFSNNEYAIDCHYVSEAEVTDNVIHQSRIGLKFKENIEGYVARNTVSVIAQTAVDCRGAAAIELHANCFFDVVKGVECDDAAHVKISDTVIVGKVVCLECRGFSNVSITNCALSNKHDVCVLFSMGSYGILTHNVFKGQSALHIQDMAEVIVSDNAIHTSYLGMRISGHARGKIENNAISGEQGKEPTGIEISGSVELDLLGNKIQNVHSGICCKETSHVKIVGTVIDSRVKGIDAIDASVVHITACEVASLKDYAIHYTDTSSGSISRNTIAGYSGIGVDGQCTVSIDHNTIVVQSVGIGYSGRSGGKVEGNTLSGRDGSMPAGIEVRGAAVVDITGNTVQNMRNGIWCCDTSQVDINGAAITTSEIGIESVGDSAVAINGCTVMSLKNYSIRYADTSHGNVVHNKIAGYNGIEADGKSSVTIQDNKIVTEYIGINCIAYVKASIENNRIEGETDKGTVGIRIAGAGEAKLQNNTIQNVRIAISSLEAGEAKIIGNKLKAWNAVVSCGERSSGSITGNMIEGVLSSTTTGIDISGWSSIAVCDNEIFGVHQGVCCSDECEVQIDKTKVESRSYGIRGGGNSAVQIRNSTVTSAHEACMLYELNSGGTVQGNAIRGINGIVIVGSSRLKVVDNIIKADRVGIICGDQSKCETDGNRIEGQLSGESTGLEISGSSQLSDNGSEITGVCCGIRCADDSCVSISRAKIYSSGSGIEAVGKSQAMSCGSLLKIELLGIAYWQSSKGKSEKNIIEGPEKGDATGVDISDHASAEIIENRISQVMCGIRCDDNARSRISGTHILSRKNGIETGGCSSATIAGNEIKAIRASVACRDNSSGSVERNSMESGGNVSSCGIDMADASQFIVKDNIIKNVTYGVLCDSKMELNIAGNKIIARRGVFIREANILDNKDVFPDISNILSRDAFRAPGGGFKGRLLAIVLKTWHYPLFNYIYSMQYRFSIKAIIAVLGMVPNLKSLYLRRGLSSKDWIPGISDIDLIAVIEQDAVENENITIKKIGDTYCFLKKIFPYLGEIQIATPLEVQNYLAYGDIRAFEASASWRLLSGVPVENRGYVIDSEKFKSDCMAEMMNAYRMLSEAFFSQSPRSHIKQQFVKQFIDVLKSDLYMREGGMRVFNSRLAILDACLERSNQQICRHLLYKIRDVRAGNADMPESLFTEAYVYILNVLEQGAKGAVATMRSDKVGTEYCFDNSTTPLGCLHRIEDERISRWRSFCEEVFADSGGYVKGLILDDPGLCYIVIKDDVIDKEDFVKKMCLVQDLLRNTNLTRRTHGLVVTESMFQSLLLSLHFESPFNYFKLCNGVCAISEANGEERLSCNVRREKFFMPSDHLLQLLVQETVVTISISLRMFERMVTINNVHKLIYLYNRVLAAQLAMEKKVIVSQNLTNICAVYQKYYPEHVEYIEAFKSDYFSQPAYEVNMLPAQEIFYRIYPFLHNILARLSRGIHAKMRL